MTTRHETLLETELRQALTPVGEPGPALKARICGAAAANPPRRRISRLALIAAVAAVFLLTATVAYALFSDKDFRRELAADYDIATFCSTEDTIYFSQMAYTADKRQISLIYFADRATGITAPLCGKPECDHTGSGCNAYVQDFIYGLAVYDGQLYAASASGPIWRMNMDGTDRQLVRTIDSEILYADGGSSGQVWFHRGYAYSLSNFYTISGGEDIEGVKEYAVSLTDPDEPPVIILHEKYPGKAVYDHYHLAGDYLYISLGLYDWEELNLQEENAEKPAYEFENDFTIYRWDMQSRTLETVYHDASTTLSINDMWAMEDGLLMEGYYGGDLGVYWLDFATGQITRRFALDEGWLFSGFADNMVITEGWDPQPQVKTYRVLDFDGNVLLETRFDVPAGAANATEEDVKANRSDWWGNSTFGADEEYLYGAFNHYASEDDGNGHVLEGTAEEGTYFYEVSLETGECRFIGQNISKQ